MQREKTSTAGDGLTNDKHYACHPITFFMFNVLWQGLVTGVCEWTTHNVGIEVEQAS